MLSLFQDLFGLAIGPSIDGVLSDALGLDNALTLTPLACAVAAAAFLMAGGVYQVDKRRGEEPAPVPGPQGVFA